MFILVPLTLPFLMLLGGLWATRSVVRAPGAALRTASHYPRLASGLVTLAVFWCIGYPVYQMLGPNIIGLGFLSSSAAMLLGLIGWAGTRPAPETPPGIVHTACGWIGGLGGLGVAVLIIPAGIMAMQP